jgi:hypothetical protein
MLKILFSTLLLLVRYDVISDATMRTNEDVRSVHVVFSHHLDVGLDFSPDKNVTDVRSTRNGFLTQTKCLHTHTRSALDLLQRS